MAGGFVVETESRPRRADLREASRKLYERRGPRAASSVVQVVAIGRAQRIRAQGVLEVGDDQLLMLLFVVQPQFDPRPHGFVATPKQRHHRRVHVLAVGVHLLDGRPRQRPAPGAWERLADAVVVGVEEFLEALDERPVPLYVRLEQEGLEEPGGVREVPLGRARVVHRLDAIVVHGERTAQHLRLPPHGRVSRDRIVRDLRGFGHAHLVFAPRAYGSGLGYFNFGRMRR